MQIHNEDGNYDSDIDELITTYHADTTDMLTPLQCMLNGHWWFTVPAAMRLVNKGANVDTTDTKGNTLLHLLAKSREDETDAA